MKLRPYHDENDYWRIRAFLRDTALTEWSRADWQSITCWPVARLDYWRWHVSVWRSFSWEETLYLWETASGQIAAVINPEGLGEAHIQIHPDFRSDEFLCRMIAAAEEKLSIRNEHRQRSLSICAYDFDVQLGALLAAQGYSKEPRSENQHCRALDGPIPDVPVADGYTIRALGDLDELPARSWASWRGFHPDEPDENYQGWTWYHNIQRMPLYRRDLDIVAVAPDGCIAAFCTLWYDDVTRIGYFEPVATVPEHRRRGLGKAVMTEAMRRIQRLGAAYVTVGGYSEQANALYNSAVSPNTVLIESWTKIW